MHVRLIATFTAAAFVAEATVMDLGRDRTATRDNPHVREEDYVAAPLLDQCINVNGSTAPTGGLPVAFAAVPDSLTVLPVAPLEYI